MKKLFAVIGMTVLAAALIGCRAPLNCVFVGSGTTVGFDVSQSVATQSPQATLAYKRVEIAVVPVGTNSECPDVIMDFSFKTTIFASGGGIYSRVAVGKNACTQVPAALMMSKSRTGELPSPVLFPYLLQSLTTKTNK